MKIATSPQYHSVTYLMHPKVKPKYKNIFNEFGIINRDRFYSQLIQNLSCVNDPKNRKYKVCEMISTV